MAERETPKTWIFIRDGDIVKNHSIEGLAFARIITDVQRVIDNIGASKYGKDYKKEDLRLYFKDIQEGSVVAPMYPITYPASPDSKNLFTEITGIMERLITTLNTKPDLFREQLESEITSPPERIGLLKSLASLSSSNTPVEIKTSVKKPQNGHFIPKHYTSYLNDLLIDYGGYGEVSVSGVIVRINGDKNYYFTIEAKNGHKYNCYFDPSKEETVKSLYKKWVGFKGDMTKTQKQTKIHSVKELDEVKTETLHNAENYVFKEPIKFDVHYDNDDKLWCIENESLSLSGYGTSYNKALNSLTDEIEGHVLSFTNFPDEKHSSESLRLKERLSVYIDFKAAKKIIDGKYGGV
ncbi:hypothetical protein [Methanoplanus limicola]|uniref:Uncharacterized protein n=1 Tax=Methanoplanus limicola DSM 2279 TaxID=937775 RepID=H1YYM4_9EURY|nr:hypothetical protein [Methanoplanus limicola]EHQ36007.1 hypothetical protein Metlim_1908 [Methanoplanus limicola DSM 2279]